MFNINSVQLENSAFSESHSPQKKQLQLELNKLNNLTGESENMADTLEMQTVFATSKGATEALMAASVHQKEIVAQMMSSNPEDSISLALAASIEAYGKQLEGINAWTEGGSAVLEPMLDMIYESILVDGVDGTEYEDLMQLLVIDLLMHEEEWGLVLPSEYDVYFAQITEHFGSGLHAPYGQYDEHPPEEIISWFLDTLIPTLEEQIPNPIPNSSLTAKIVGFYSDESHRDGLEQCADDYWTDPNGFINGSDENSAADCERLSPILKIFILADAAEEGIITAEEWDQLITGDVSDFEALLGVKDGELGLYLTTNVEGWAPSNGANGEAGSHVEDGRYPDFTSSAGIYPDDLIHVLDSFPGRELTEEEIEEVNRIGDQVKMLQQTLLYWLKICRDEQMAIAQNT
ncbi:hypothetical protein AB4179_24355 [Vibrio lentus]|uniref:Uncharacterized protein n=1 Tax=Vibrio splendidus TaxID=29497 RepID=A0A2N7CHC7_VIBSP|nr:MULTISPECIES: hypothetical protein [Vibrio]MDH5928700.1 hypothetical protein [Vibrio lentus]PMF25607.1 hypothetical protein BCV19_00730 [Vibrio splendidus]